MCGRATGHALCLAPTILLIVATTSVYILQTGNVRSLMARIDELADKAVPVSCSSMSQGFAVTGPVFLSCDVFSTPDLNTAPELGPLRSVLSPSNAYEKFIAYHVRVEVWKYSTWGGTEHTRSYCLEEWASLEETSCGGHATPPNPQNLASAVIMGAAAEIEIGDSEAPFVLTPPLRLRLLSCVKPVGLEVSPQQATERYNPAGLTLVAQNFGVAPHSVADTTELVTGSAIGDVRASLAGYKAGKISVFALARQGMPGPDEAKPDLDLSVKDMFSLSLMNPNPEHGLPSRDVDLYAVWPRMNASSSAGLQGKQKVLLSEWGDEKLAFVLEGAYTKTSAAEKLKSEAKSDARFRLVGLLVASVWAACCGCGRGGYFDLINSDNRLDKCFGIVWGLVLAVSIANIFVALISFFVQGSFVPLISAWSVACACCGCCMSLTGGSELHDKFEDSSAE